LTSNQFQFGLKCVKPVTNNIDSIQNKFKF